MFRRIVFSACLAGMVAGVILTGLQAFKVVPIILEAETYESHAPAEDAASHEHADGHQHEHGAWAPDDGWERTLSTAIANIGMAIGFGLLLSAVFSLRREVDWKQGLLWGLGGFATFYLAPSLGLSPEIPGAESAALGLRQAWWVTTVALTGVGLALLVLGKAWGLKLTGVVMLALPHLIGAPHPEIHGGSAPQQLATAFFAATAIANAIFWAVLGTSGAIAYKKLA